MRKYILPLIFLGIFIYSAVGIFNQDVNLVRPTLLKVDKVFISLERAVSDILVGTKGEYAIVIKSLKNGSGFFFNQDKIFESASLYKLWIMGTVLEKIEKGELKESKVLSGEVKDLNELFEIDEEEAELKEGTVTFSVGSALNQMITISHNYAALLLSREVGRSKVAEFMKAYGFNNSEYGSPPKTSADDIALFFEKLYKGEIINKEYSQKAMELLKNQKKNDSLPKLLPKGTIIAHKTGELGKLKHDSGIVFTNSGDYIIVVLSQTDAPGVAQEKIAEISKAVYEYFNK